MPRYIIEKHLAQRLELPSEVVLLDDEIDVANDMGELFEAFFGVTESRRYHLYETARPELMSAAARDAGLPTDAIVECDP